MKLTDRYVRYIRDVRRYSDRTVAIYEKVLDNYIIVTFSTEDVSDDDLVRSLNHSEIRSYEVHLLDREGLSAKTVNLHLSVLSGFCRFLIMEGHIQSNPVRLVRKPKLEKRLPEFYSDEALSDYFMITQMYASPENLHSFLADPFVKSSKALYDHRLARLIVSCLYSTGLRRAELISLDMGDVDLGRKVVKVRGKGNKMREIPLVDSLCEEILLYLKAVEALMGGTRSLKEPLLVTYTGLRLYPVYVDRVVKSELGSCRGITGRKSPHVLRHSIATELMNEDTDLNSIKELLGHSSLAATQVYTHNTIARLKTIYEQAHPRAKNGGKNGD